MDDWSSYSDVEVVDAQGPALLIRVANLEGGPLPDVEVDLEGPEGPQNCRTDSRGLVSRTLGPGEWHITLSAVGWYPISKTIEIRRGQRTTLSA